MMRRACWLVLLFAQSAIAAPDPWADKPSPPPANDLKGPAVEANGTGKPTLPAVPALEVPVVPGAHSVLELMVAGKPLFGTTIVVHGYVTWTYDCASAIRKHGESVAKVRARIDADPTQCERPKFYIGDAPDTAVERSLWIVDVPRPFNKLERERIMKADRTLANYPDRCEPDPKRPNAPYCFPLNVGDYVAITGQLAQRSPHNETNSDGLVVLATLAPTPPTTMGKKPLLAPARKASPALVVKAVTSSPSTSSARTTSIRASNEGIKAYGQKDYALALTKLRESVAAWDGNHIAWYATGGALIGQGDWLAAAAAMERAFALVPSDPMYAMMAGRAAYEAALAKERANIARATNVPVASVQVDASLLDFTRAEQLLRHAVTLSPALWRAHYYLGRIARDQGRWSEAAPELTKALENAPIEAAPWIALGELYRKWQLPALARTVVEQGIQYVRVTETSDLWYVLGMTYDDERDDAAAITAFTKALDIDKTSTKALFQRGQARFRAGKKVDAKRDLEAYLKSPGANSFAAQQAQRMLLDLASRPRR
jgi:tetratricopeptide (TPR) repeat protein